MKQLLAALACLLVFSATALTQNIQTRPKLVERDLSGPRLGFTFVPPGSDLANALKSNRVMPVISQFGWHFEYQVVPEGGGPSFVIEFVPLLGGVESPVIIPSASLAMGIRFPNGVEFGLGPNIMLTNHGPRQALIVAGGKSFDYGGVQIPVNVVIATNPDGMRFSLIVGYALAR